MAIQGCTTPPLKKLSDEARPTAIMWAVSKIPLSFPDTAWFSAGFLYCIFMILNILASIIKKLVGSIINPQLISYNHPPTHRYLAATACSTGHPRPLLDQQQQPQVVSIPWIFFSISSPQALWYHVFFRGTPRRTYVEKNKTSINNLLFAADKRW